VAYLDEALREKLEERLRRIEKEVDGVIASILVDASGYPLAYALKSGLGRDILTVGGAALYSVAERVSRDLKMGEVEVNIIQCQKGFVIVTGVKPEALLVVAANEGAKLGVALLETKRAAIDLERLLASALAGEPSRRPDDFSGSERVNLEAPRFLG